MKIWGIFAILLVLAAAVAYVDRSAVARLEAGNFATAIKAKDRSIADVQSRVRSEQTKNAGLIRALERKAAAVPIPPAKPTGALCPKGCKVRWSDTSR